MFRLKVDAKVAGSVRNLFFMPGDRPRRVPLPPPPRPAMYAPIPPLSCVSISGTFPPLMGYDGLKFFLGFFWRVFMMEGKG